MALWKKKSDAGSRREDRKKAAQKIARARIEEARKSKATSLDVHGLGLTELPASIGQLPQLLRLHISDNQLEALPETISELTQLQILDASRNRLEALPDSIGELTQLNRLDLASNRLTSLPDAIGQLAQLQELDISRNDLTVFLDGLEIQPTSQPTPLQKLDVPSDELPEVLYVEPRKPLQGDLPKRRALRGEFEKIEPTIWRGEDLDVPTFIRLGVVFRRSPSLVRLSQLRQLNVSGNRLMALPETIGQLTQLKELNAADNKLTALPNSLGQLAQLQQLNLANNALSLLPGTLLNLTSLSELALSGNTALALPPELVASANPASILDYYFKMRSGQRALNEVRLLLVGRGAAGKTSIVRRLIERRFVEREPETKGIDIKSWELRYDDDTVRAHVWDFAGQVITHATHQFFLSHRSVYVLVLTGREDNEKLEAEYWLRLIRAFGTEPGTGQTSPVIVALNKWEAAECKVDRNALQEKYPFIVGFVETDCRSGRGLADLSKLIHETVDGMTSVREAFPRAWFAIKERLATMKANYVNYGEFRVLCRQLGETDAGAQDSLARVLHRLGVALNYADDERLREATVLNPLWVTKGIYTLLRDAACDRGLMTLADVERVLPQEKPEMRRYLVELMRRFDLAFPLNEAGDEWLVPQRLPPTQPKLGREWQEPGLTRLRYTYTALPEGLIPRFITRTYPLSEGEARWVNGVVLVMDEARALVRADPSERCVTAVVSGSADGRRRLAGLVREDLRRIHADIRGLDPLEEMELEDRSGE